MENYNEKINYGTKEEPILRQRLIVNNIQNGYGYSLYDRKKKINYLYAKLKETCQKGKDLLLEGKIEDFNELKESVKDYEIKTNQILIYKEKYGDRYFNVSTLKDLFRVSLFLLEMKVDYGYIQKWDLPVELGYTKDDIKNLPQIFYVSLIAEVKDKLSQYERDLQGTVEHNKECDMVYESIETEDGSTAWKIVQNRSNNEYEGVDIIRVEII